MMRTSPHILSDWLSRHLWSVLRLMILLTLAVQAPLSNGPVYAAALARSNAAPVCSNGWCINGSAAVQDNKFILTPNSFWQGGSLWNQTPIDLKADFDKSFFVYLGADDGGADGLVFVLQNTGLQALGGQGIDLGYGGITPSIGVEVDTWLNSDKGDPTYDHIGIDENGAVTHTGAAPVQASETFPNIEDGREHLLRINWKAASRRLTVYFDDNKRLTYFKDLVNTIFGGNSMVYFGFTAATGSARNLQYVITDLTPRADTTTIDQAACVALTMELHQNGDLPQEDSLNYYPGFRLSYPDPNYGNLLSYADLPNDQATPCMYQVSYQTIDKDLIHLGPVITATVVRFAGIAPLRILNYAAYYATGAAMSTNGDNRHDWCFSGDNMIERADQRDNPELFTKGYNVGPISQICNLVDPTAFTTDPAWDVGPCGTLVASVYRAMHYYNSAYWDTTDPNLDPHSWRQRDINLAAFYYGVQGPSLDLHAQLTCTKDCIPSHFSRSYHFIDMVYHHNDDSLQTIGTTNPDQIWLGDVKGMTWDDVGPASRPKPGDLAITIWGNANPANDEHYWSHIQIIVGWGPADYSKFTGKNLYSRYDNIPQAAVTADGQYVPYAIDRGLRNTNNRLEDYPRRGPRPYNWYYSATKVELWVATGS